MSATGFRRLSVAAQGAVIVPAERPERGGALARTIPPLERLCPGRYPKGTAYGEILDPVRVPRAEGKFVRLGRGAGAVVAQVHVMSAPPRPTLTQMRRESCSLCEPGYVVSVEEAEGPRYLAVNARQVRELNRRQREGLCPHHKRITREFLARVSAEVEQVEASGGHPRDVSIARDLPYPHRRGSSPCCESSEFTPEKVLARLRAWSSGDRRGLTGAELVAMAGRAIPHGSGVAAPRLLSEIPAAMAAVRDHCWGSFAARLAQATEGRKDKFVRLKAEVASRYTSKRAPGGGFPRAK